MAETETLYAEPITATMGRRFRIRKMIHTRETPYQKVDVVETHEFGVTLFLDRRFQTSERDEFFYHESLVHPPMLLHPSPRDILIIGGGDGGALEEIAKYRTVRRITMVELDPEVVDVARRYLQAICGKAFEDHRVELVIGDGRRFVEETDRTYDVILLDLTDPMEPSKYVYTREFYEICRSRLNTGGILGLHNDSAFFFPEAFNVISKTLDTVFPHKRQYLAYILGYMLDFVFSACSSEPLPDLDTGAVRRRMGERGIGPLQYYSAQRHPLLFALPGYVQSILERPCEISTDAAPYVLVGAEGFRFPGE
jgi:spermidine synthase